MGNVKVLILRSRAVMSPPSRWTFQSVFEMPGSCYMRAEQLRDVVAPHLDTGITLDIRGISRSRMPSKARLTWISRYDLVIMTKRVGYSLPLKAIDAIRDTGVRVGIDHVDGKLANLATADAFDFHISASIDGAKAFAGIFPTKPVVHIAHHADPRISASRCSDHISAVYFGNPSHLFIPDALKPRVTVLHAAHQRDADRSVGRLSSFNLHYAVRPQIETTSRDQFRPFTKGFNAAAARSNVIAQRTAADALHYLGSDYPYLVDTANDNDVVAAFERARESFGSAEWRRGLDTMKHVRSEVSPAHIARDFSRMIETVL